MLLPGLALAQTSGQRPPTDTTRTRCLGNVEVRGEILSTSKVRAFLNFPIRSPS